MLWHTARSGDATGRERKLVEGQTTYQRRIRISPEADALDFTHVENFFVVRYLHGQSMTVEILKNLYTKWGQRRGKEAKKSDC